MSVSLNFVANRSVHQVLTAGTWSSQKTFSKFYLRNYTRKRLDKFYLELGPVVAGQSVVNKRK